LNHFDSCRHGIFQPVFAAAIALLSSIVSHIV